MARWQGDDIRIDLGRVDEVHVRAVAGEVVVTASDGAPRVEAVVEAGPTIEVSLEGGVLTVDHETLRRGAARVRRAVASIALRVPPSTSVRVSAVSADVTAAGMTEGLRVVTVSGAVVVTDVGGGVDLQVVSGAVDATAIEGDIRINTVSGDVTASGWAGDLTARSVSGDLTFDLESLGDASITTVSGDAMVRLPADASGDIDLITTSGAIDCGFPVDGTSTRRRLAGGIGRTSADSTSDVEISTSVRARTMSGDIALLRHSHARAASAGARDEA